MRRSELRCRSLHCLIELRAEFRRRNEQIVGIFKVRQNLVEDKPAVEPVQSHAGQVLQPQVAIAINLRIGQPALQIGCARPAYVASISSGE